MKIEDLQFDSIDEIYEIMRDNLGHSYNKLLETVDEIENEKKDPLEIVNNILELCSLTYYTVDAMLQIQLGIIKDKNNQTPNRQ